MPNEVANAMTAAMRKWARKPLEYRILSLSVKAGSLEETDREAAIRTYEKALDLGGAKDVAVLLGHLIQDEDPERAAELFEQAYKAGDVEDGAAFLAWAIENDDPKRAKRLLQESLNAGNELAALSLAEMVLDEDPDYALELLAFAFEKGERTWSPFLTAQLVERNDLPQALRNYEIAAESGNPAAMVKLALLVEEDDIERSKSLLARAIAHEDSDDALKALAARELLSAIDASAPDDSAIDAPTPERHETADAQG